MIASIIINLLNAVLIVAAIVWAMGKTEDKKIVFRFFTVLSNLLCAAASVAVAVVRLCGTSAAAETWIAGASGQGGMLPAWVSVLKFVGTCAVTVTLLTVFVFLAPSLGSLGELLAGQDLFLHLVCPVLAIVSYIFFDKVHGASSADPYGTLRNGGLPLMLLGVLPVILYGVFYLYKVIYAPEGRRWEDFYTFNRGGKWPVSFAAMVLGALVISLVLWISAFNMIA